MFRLNQRRSDSLCINNVGQVKKRAVDHRRVVMFMMMAVIVVMSAVPPMRP